jgi:hypothetical protein
MKRIVQLLASSLALIAAITPAHGFSLTAGFSRAIAVAVEMSTGNPNPKPSPRGVEYAISVFDEAVVEAFRKAWRRSGNGTSGLESVVLILRMSGGGYSGRDMGVTNEHRRFTFAWHPATIAVVHTHPNDSDPKPQDEDIAVADKHGVPIFTITNRGMYAYDPNTRKTGKVADNLDWLESSTFVARKAQEEATPPT